MQGELLVAAHVVIAMNKHPGGTVVRSEIGSDDLRAHMLPVLDLMEASLERFSSTPAIRDQQSVLIGNFVGWMMGWV